MKIADRFLRYVQLHTASVDDSDTVPSHPREFNLADALKAELTELGAQDVYEDEHAYVYGRLKATPGHEAEPCVAFIAHIDTVPDFSGENVKPQLIADYDGGAVALGESGRVLDPVMFPDLPARKGQTLITTDGTTVLGADDKAGVAAIVTAVETLINENRPHGPVAFCFTPDEEIGHGAALLDLHRLGAEFAYTVDGDALNEVNFETFNAASARWEINGFNVHPGSAKDVMVNASLVAMEINAMLPAEEIPAHTEGYEGFYHLTGIQGDVAHAQFGYILRDHDAAKLAAKKQRMKEIETAINEKYGAGTAILTLTDSYRNMAEILSKDMRPVEIAEQAIRQAGLNPERIPVRGGTDGAELSFRGLPCPNIGTGGAGYHGPYEHITVEALEKCTEIVLNIVTLA